MKRFVKLDRIRSSGAIPIKYVWTAEKPEQGLKGDGYYGTGNKSVFDYRMTKEEAQIFQSLLDNGQTSDITPTYEYQIEG